MFQTENAILKIAQQTNSAAVHCNSVYETYELLGKFYDPTSKYHLAAAQVRGEMVFKLVDSIILPYDCQDYAIVLRKYADKIYNISMKHP